MDKSAYALKVAMFLVPCAFSYYGDVVAAIVVSVFHAYLIQDTECKKEKRDDTL